MEDLSGIELSPVAHFIGETMTLEIALLRRDTVFKIIVVPHLLTQ